jgi:hypothetical protein
MSLTVRNSPCFNAVLTLDDGSVFGRERAQQWPGVVTLGLSFFSVKEAVEPQGLSSQGGSLRDEGDELYPAGHEALDVQDVQTLVEPVDEEVDRVDSVGPDGARLSLLD